MPENSLVETPLGGGLQQQIHEAHRPFGELTIAKNIRQPKNGLIAKRPGNAKLSNQYQQPNGLGAASVDVSMGGALAAHGNQLLLTTNAGIAAYSPTLGTFNVPQPTSEAGLTRVGVAIPQVVQANLGTSLFLMAPAMCTDGARNYYCWVNITNDCYVIIEDIATGDIVNGPVQPNPGNTTLWAVPIMVGTQFTVVGLDFGGNVWMAGWTSPYFSTLPNVTAALQSGVGMGGMIDAVAINSNLFAVSEDVGTTGVTLKTFNAAGTNIGGPAAAITEANVFDSRLSVDLSSGTLWLAYAGSGNTLKLAAYTSSGATLTQLLAPFTVISATIFSFAPCALSGTKCAIAYTYSSGGNDATQCDVVDRTLSAGAGGFTVQAANTSFSCVLASRPFTQGSKTYVWLQVYSDSGGSQNASLYGIAQLNQTQWTYVLCDTSIDSAQSSFPHPMRPVAVDSPRFAFAVSNRGVTNSGATQAPLSVCSPGANKWTTMFGIRASAYITTWSRILADFNDPSRWKSIELNGNLLQSSGMVCCWDGQRAFENGFIHHICKPQFSVTAGGFLTSSAAYYYKGVPMQTDGAGNVHRGIPSILATTSTTGTNKTIAVIVPPLSLTLRAPFASSSTKTNYRVSYEIYRSQPNPGSTGTDVATDFLDTAIATRNGFLTYIDAGAVSDALTAANAACYTFGGALPNGCPPGAKDIVAHQGRAWVLADDGQTWYFSKQVVQGEAVNFTDSFTTATDTPDAIAGASMDDKFISFGLRNIYYLVGLGPADNGTQSDYTGFQKIQSNVGCSDRRSIVSTDVGIFFRSPVGIQLLDRGLSVSYIGQPVADELATYPTIVSASLHPTQPWVYFYVTNVAGNAGERLVYDYRVQKWYVDALPGVPVSSASTADGTHYWLDTTGQVWAETPADYRDNGVYVVSDWETTMHAVGIDGWQNVQRMQLLFNRNTPHDLTIQTRPMYGSTYDAPPKAWNDQQLSAMVGFMGQPGQVGQLEIVPDSSKVNAIAVRVTDAAPTGGAAIGTGQGPSFFALAFMTQPDPAVIALVSDAQRGNVAT